MSLEANSTERPATILNCTSSHRVGRILPTFSSRIAFNIPSLCLGNEHVNVSAASGKLNRSLAWIMIGFAREYYTQAYWRTILISSNIIHYVRIENTPPTTVYFIYTYNKTITKSNIYIKYFWKIIIYLMCVFSI